VDVDVISRRDVVAGEPDHLAVLEDRLPLADRPDRELVSHFDRLCDPQSLADELDVGPARDGASCDDDVVLGPQMDGDIEQGNGRHSESSSEPEAQARTEDTSGRAMLGLACAAGSNLSITSRFRKVDARPANPSIMRRLFPRRSA